jgi:hypothetical protein
MVKLRAVNPSDFGDWYPFMRFLNGRETMSIFGRATGKSSNDARYTDTNTMAGQPPVLPGFRVLVYLA